MPHPAYDRPYQRIRAMMLDPPVPCAHCRKRVATTLDHDPPIAMHVHRQGADCCRLIPSCEECNRRGGVMVANGTWRPTVELADTEPEPERDGLPAAHRCWRVPWLRELRSVPEDATWPRLMSVPHRRAVGSAGAEFIAWAEDRSGAELRWWQRLVSVRLLEVDADGRLVWEAAVVSTARQVGKSWLLRELALWRMHQGDRFGEPQDVLHTGKDLAVCKEVQRRGRIWAKARSEYAVREVNGQEQIELLADGSRWMLRAKEAVYGYAASLALVDEAWRVKASSVDEGLTPTMAEREQAQLLLFSTAHRKATGLVLDRRKVALEELEDGDGDLLVEWSAPEAAEDDDRAGWRLASPHWTPRRERLVSRAHDRMLAGESEDPEEPDPVASFRAQWLNRWPRKRVDPSGPTEPLLLAGVWDGLREPGLVGVEPLWVAVEDDYGMGAAVACCRRTDDGRLEVDGWLRGDWDSAIADAQQLAELHTVRRLLVGASMADRVPAGLRAVSELRAGSATRSGLALFRDLALGGQLVHDVTTAELDQTIAIAMVREAPTGLFLVSKGPTHLVRAMVWALLAAHRPAAVPAIH
jgi:hypothetical protein